MAPRGSPNGLLGQRIGFGAVAIIARTRLGSRWGGRRSVLKNLTDAEPDPLRGRGLHFDNDASTPAFQSSRRLAGGIRALPDSVRQWLPAPLVAIVPEPSVAKCLELVFWASAAGRRPRISFQIPP